MESRKEVILMIKVLLFAQLREQLGVGELQTEFPGGTVKEFKNFLRVTYSLTLDNMMIAVNEEFSENEVMIKAGDVVAIIPPVSGG